MRFYVTIEQIKNNPNYTGAVRIGLCKMCSKEFLYYRSDGVSGNYCSLSCANKSPERIEKLRKATIGKKATAQAKINMSKAHIGKHIGKNSGSWKGNNIKYMPMHNWVRKEFGDPKKCEHCGLDDVSKKYDWANKSGNYLRDRDDWIRLCRKCHVKYDNIGERSSKTFLDRKASGEYELRVINGWCRRWCKKETNV